jgi:NDP-sugar pyrophosphorylase family protein
MRENLPTIKNRSENKIEQKEQLLAETTVYINAGGRGTRMESIFSKGERGITKALIEFNGKPMIKSHVDLIKNFGFRNIVVGGGDHQNVADYFSKLDLEDVEVVTTSQQEDTGGDLIKAVRENENTFGASILVENVDTLLYVKTINDLLKQHKKTKALATIVLTTKKGVPNEDAFFVDGNGKVIFSKESRSFDNSNEPINFKGYRGSSTGMVVFDKERLLNYRWQAGDGKLSIYGDIIPDLIQQGGLMAYNTGKVFFIDTGTPTNYKRIKRHEKKVFGGLKNKYLKQ